MSSGMNWIEPMPDKSLPIITEVVVKHLEGYQYECVAKTSNMDDFSVEVPYPPLNTNDVKGQSLYAWAYDLSDAEILAGAQVFYDIWTWHDSSERYRELMDLFDRVAKSKLSRSPTPFHVGDTRFDPNTDKIYTYDGVQWILIGI
jgi:hypothetical protein